MDLIELGASLAPFFEHGIDSPSHDELSNATKRFGLTGGDPRATSPNEVVGKVRRIRLVFQFASDNDPDAGLKLAKHLVSLCRSRRAFVAGSPAHPGDARITALRQAFRDLGYDLDGNGGLRPLVVDNLTGTQLTDALQSYVRRANLNPDDAPLQVGTGKDLDEAAARHVLEQRTGSYPHQGSFPHTLAQAFIALNLEPAPQGMMQSLSSDPHKAVQQSLHQLACAVNRLRNEVGTGHGRPSQSARTAPLSPAEARLVARATALVAGILLDSL